MSVSVGVYVKIAYVFISILVWGMSKNILLNMGMDVTITGFLSFFAFLAVLAAFFPQIRDFLSDILDALTNLFS